MFILSPSAGADKKAEAGAGAATEFQFVSTLLFKYLAKSSIGNKKPILVMNVFLLWKMRNATECSTLLSETLFACGCGFTLVSIRNVGKLNLVCIVQQ